uniref:Thiol-disulfide oxidoreductase DCC n=1 Tax=Dunaliella tertiolecta TaxID=3047 RepID=A0A7S3QRX7_DUNTE
MLLAQGNVPARPSKTTSSSQEGTKKHMLLHQLFPHTARTSHIHSHPTRLTSNVVRRRTVSALTRAAGTGSSSTAANSTADVSKDYFQGDSRPIILYDGVCNLCNGAVNIMLDLDPEGKHFRMAALQSPAGRTLLQRCGRSPDDISSIVLVEPNYKGHIRSDAILKIAAGLSNPFPLLAFLGFPVPPFIRDALYDQVANNRYRGQP